MSFWGVLGFLQKAYSLGFSATRPPRGKNSSLVVAGVCPDKTYQNKPVPFWQVVSTERRAVRLVVIGDVLKRLVKQERPQ